MHCWFNSKKQIEWFSKLLQPIFRLSCNSLEGNAQKARNFQENQNFVMHEGVGEVQYHDVGDRGLTKGIKLDFSRFVGKNPST